MRTESKRYWVTVVVEATNQEAAETIARDMAREVVAVDHEPPQGAMIVGPMYEDELPT
jgi:hypothetical protein